MFSLIFIRKKNFRKIYGNLTEVRGDKFASAIDSTPPDTFVIIHIYDDVS